MRFASLLSSRWVEYLNHTIQAACYVGVGRDQRSRGVAGSVLPVGWDFVETCFHGDSVVAPRGEGQRHESPDDADVPHAILERNDSSCVWESRTRGNPTMRHATTQAISFEIDAPIDASVVLEVNGHRYEHRLAELAVGARCHFLRGLAHEAVRIGPLVPVSRCTVTSEFRDTPERDVDYYRLQVSQHNGQWAWSTPVWVRQ
jgi:hypothetical protein